MPDSITLSKSITLAVPCEALWSFLSDTDRLNKSVGLPAIEFTPHSNPKKKGYYAAKAKIAGIPIRYEELPYDWVENHYYQITRRFTFGPIKELGIRYTFLAQGDSTSLELTLFFSPHNIISSFLARYVFGRLAYNDVFNMAKAFEKKYRFPSESEETPYEKMNLVNESRIHEKINELSSVFPNEKIIARLEKHVRTSSDINIVRIRPFELADQWAEDRYDVLKSFIYGTKVGLFDLHWTVLCPNCRGVSTDAVSLAELKSETHCDTCEISYGSDLASSVEARFTINPSVRLARHETYCIGGPANMPQIVSQLRLLPNEKKVETFFVQPGTIRIRCYQIEGIETVQIVDNKQAPSSLSVSFGNRNLCTTNILNSGEITFTATNETNEEILIAVERETWKETAATAAIVTTMQEFRDLFPAEAVASGEELGISSIAVLFTDLKSSTALYKNIGDTRAFEFVQNHFRFLTESVSKNHGGIIKTMGDAVMASFAGGHDAVEAALEMQNSWNKFRSEYGNHDSVELKIGIHEGAAIVINNRGKLDYFGTTINIAGRLQKLSFGGDIVLSEAVYTNPNVSATLSNLSSSISCKPFSAELKGLDDRAFNLLRVSVK